MVRDVLAETQRRMDALSPASVADIRRQGQAVVAFSGAMRQNDRALKDFLHENMYRGDPVVRETTDARRMVTELFRGLMAAPDRLPADWRKTCEGRGEAALARLVADYIAGMTDRFAKQEHTRLTSERNRNT